jgi:adenine-specific DNA glycosylase
MKDNINPNHYKQGKIEVIEFILDQKFNYLEGNVVKYISRYKFKNGIEDLNKAKWYLDLLTEEYINEDD